MAPSRAGPRRGNGASALPFLHLILYSGAFFHLAITALAHVSGELSQSQQDADNSEAGRAHDDDDDVTATRRILQDQTSGGAWYSPRRRPPGECWSKEEQRHYFKDGSSIVHSPKLKEQLKTYAKMHARCSSPVQDWKAYFADASSGLKEGADVSGCKYLLFQSPAWHGVGNRLMGLVSAFAYALLTGRTILIDEDEFLGKAFCNPFPDSTWKFPRGTFNHILTSVKDTLKDPQKNTTVFDLHISWNWTPWNEFCEARQLELDPVRFGVFYTDFYLVPLLYLTKRFQMALDSLIPDRRLFLHLGRAILFPANHLWDRITRTFHGYLSHHNQRIGLQIRETKETGEVRGLMGNVFDCLVNKSQYLTDAIPVQDWRQLALKTHEDALLSFPRKSTGIFVTSLNGQHASLLKDRYTRGKPMDGSSVSVYSLSHYSKEIMEDYVHYESATIEMWLLSFSHRLLITDYSTFGYVATGLSGLDTFVMNVAHRGSNSMDWRKNGRPSCVPAFSEPCLVADVFQKCPNHEEAQAAWDSSFLQKCPGVDAFVMVARP